MLFAYSYDYVGDLAETVALIWPDEAKRETPPGLSELVDTLRLISKSSAPPVIADWLDGFDPTTRWAFLKLITGAMRVGVSSRLTKTALAQLGDVDTNDVEQLWHGIEPPYTDLLAWLDGHGPRPDISGRLIFSPLMLAQPIDETELTKLDPAAFYEEWK